MYYLLGDGQANLDTTPADDNGDEIIVIGKRFKTQSASAPGGTPSGAGPLLSIIAHSGGTNNPMPSFVEALRGLFTSQTDYDLDTNFTAKQKEIILKALRGLADHPVYSDAMATLATKGADINIVADYTGEYTHSLEGAIAGLNDDGTVDRGESITIYINMNFGGEPISDFSFATVVVHELVHSLGVPAFTAELDAAGSMVDRDLRNDIFSGYNFLAPAQGSSIMSDVIDAPDTGGVLSGSSGYEIFSGSSFADVISPGAGGSLVYSGEGDDRFVLSVDNDIDEIIDSGGLDTLELPASVSFSAVSFRWSSDGSSLFLSINGHVEATIIDAAGVGKVEQISIGGVSRSVDSFVASANHAPNSTTTSATVYDSFYGGWVAQISSSDVDGDHLTYRMGDITGEYSDQPWRVDGATGAIFGDFTRIAEEGSQYTFLTVLVSDGIEETGSDVVVRWGNSHEVIGPIENSRMFVTDDHPVDGSSIIVDCGRLEHLDSGMLYA